MFAGSVRADTREAIARPLITLLSKCMESTSLSDNTAHPCSGTTSSLIHSDGEEQECGKKLQSANVVRKKDFSLCSVKYITEQEDIVEEEHLEAQHTLHSITSMSSDSCRQTEEPSMSDDGQEYKDSSDGIFEPSPRFRRPFQHKPPPSHGSPTSSSSQTNRLLVRAIKKHKLNQSDLCKKLSGTIPRAYEKYMTYPLQSSIGPAKHRSYLWLLDTCASHLDTTANRLEFAVRKLEVVIFPQTKVYTVRRKLKVQRKVQKIMEAGLKS